MNLILGLMSRIEAITDSVFPRQFYRPEAGVPESFIL